MKLKPITAIIVLLLVVASLLVAGCTTSNTSNTNQTPSAATSTGNTADKSDLSKDITASYVSRGYVVVKEFTKATNQYGNAVYTGVVKDNNATQLGTIYQHNVTIELTKNKTDTIQRLATIYKSRGIPENTTGIYEYRNNTIGYDIRIGGCEPNIICVEFSHLIRFGNFTVTIEEETKLE
jgi:outer membrane murein-binding lipoprotein Lpp